MSKAVAVGEIVDTTIDRASNYLIHIAFAGNTRIEVLEGPQAARLIESWNKLESETLISINGLLVQRRDIHLIEKTDKLSPRQLAVRESERAERDKRRARMEELNALRLGHRSEYLVLHNIKLANYWKDIKLISEIEENFATKYPNEDKELSKLVNEFYPD